MLASSKRRKAICPSLLCLPGASPGAWYCTYSHGCHAFGDALGNLWLVGEWNGDVGIVSLHVSAWHILGAALPDMAGLWVLLPSSRLLVCLDFNFSRCTSGVRTFRCQWYFVSPPHGCCMRPSLVGLEFCVCLWSEERRKITHASLKYATISCLHDAANLWSWLLHAPCRPLLQCTRDGVKCGFGLNL